MPELTREEFEKALIKQNYQNYQKVRSGPGQHKFVRTVEPYELMVIVEDEQAKRYKWWLQGLLCRPIPAYQDIDRISAYSETGETYDIEQFNEAVVRLAKHIQTEFIPKQIKEIQLPEELSDLLKKEK